MLENSRMCREWYVGVWDEGRVDPLEPAPRLGYATSPGSTPVERAAAEQEYFAHNRRAYGLLRERGFLSR
jgi:hypothetical protein